MSLNVDAADTPARRLKGLLGRVRLKADEGLWVVPSHGVHSVGLLFPVDLIYLDSALRVIHVVESFGTFRIAPLRRKCASVLQLPTRTIYASQTEVGDELWIAPIDKMEKLLKERQAAKRARKASGSEPGSARTHNAAG